MRRSRRRTIIIATSVAFGLVVLGSFGFLKPVQAALDYTTTPFRHVFRGLGGSISGFGTSLGEINRLESENAKLQSQVNQLRQMVADDAEIRHQNDILRSQLQIGGSSPGHLVAADVIGYQPDNFRQYLTIARGSNDGLKAGMAVVSDGVLVGTISDVNKTTAKVFLVTDPNFKVGAIDQASRATGTVQGQLGTGLAMNLIAQGDSVSPGDSVITSGLGGDLPKGIIIGQIQSVDQRDNQVFQSAQLSTPLKVTKLELVFVVAGP